MDNSLIPRAFSPTDAKREREANAREAERRSSARNASSSTIGAGGKLTLAGGIDVVAGGEVKVIGQGMNGGVPYIVTAEVTNFVDEGQQDYQSPGLVFTSEIYGSNRAYINSRDGRSVTVNTEDSATGKFGRLDVGTTFSGIHMGANGADIRETRIQGFQDQLNAYLDRSVGNIRAGVLVEDGLTTGGEVRAGHMPRFPSTTKAQLRTQSGGKLWLESKGAGTSAIVMDGAGNIDLQTTGALTQNGAPISGGGGGAVSSVAGKTGDVTLVKGDVGLGNVDNTSDANKPVSTATQSALDGKVNTGPQHAEFTLTAPVPSGGPLAAYTASFTADAANTAGTPFATTPSAGRIGLPAGVYAIFHYLDCGASMGTGAVVSIQDNGMTKRYASVDVVAGSYNAGISHPCIYLASATNLTFSAAQFSGVQRTGSVRVSIEKIK